MINVYFKEEENCTEEEFHAYRKKMIFIYGTCPVHTRKDFINKINIYEIKEDSIIERLKRKSE